MVLAGVQAIQIPFMPNKMAKIKKTDIVDCVVREEGTWREQKYGFM